MCVFLVQCTVFKNIGTGTVCNQQRTQIDVEPTQSSTSCGTTFRTTAGTINYKSGTSSVTTFHTAAGTTFSNHDVIS